jgi:hypothetical protein
VRVPATAPSAAPAAPLAAAPVAPGPDALEGMPPPDDGHELAGPPQIAEISFERSPGWAVELDGRAGVGFLTRSDARGAFAFAGALLRGHYQYFELGGFYDHADSTESGGTFFHAGGFAGAWLPYHNWVDFEAALGFGVRRYTDSDTRYGPNGYAVNAPALSLMLGVSDRANSGDAGARVGGQVVLTQDLGKQTQPWTLTQADSAGDVVTTSGSTRIGGFSASLVITIGFDYGMGPN